MADIYHLPTNHFPVIWGLKLLILSIKEKNLSALWKDNPTEIQKAQSIKKWMSHVFR